MNVNVLELYQHYEPELRRLCQRLRTQYHRLVNRGDGAGFGDVEGEVMYLLLRETKPDLVFEISPYAGWSTNYILAALTANRKGVVHSFEIARKIRGQPTNQVIRRNQCEEWEQDRLIIHLGDARTLVSQVRGPIGFLLLDSCHDAEFARWYIQELFPRVHGAVFIQDIAFTDHLEPSTEATEVWAWARSRGIPLQLVGGDEEAVRHAGLRQGYAERRMLRSNSVFFSLPVAHSGQAGAELSANGVFARINATIERGAFDEADRLLNQRVSHLLWSPHVVNRHRDFVMAALAYQQLGNQAEAARSFQRALGVALAADPLQRAKGLVELVRPYLANRQWRLASLGLAAAVLERRARQVLLKKIMSKLTKRDLS